jgi:glycerol dehydrogenase-like iron-containing ADH family enzyme
MSYNPLQSGSLSAGMPSPAGMPALGLVTMLAPAQIVRGHGILAQAGDLLGQLGARPLVIGGDRTLAPLQAQLQAASEDAGGCLAIAGASYGPDCCEMTLGRLREAVAEHQADFVIGVGGGKALDTAKLVAHQCKLPIVTIPTSGATCAAWSALSNVYSEAGAFLYDVGLRRCPDLLILDYDLLATAPPRLLVAGIGDALAKWYEASVSSGASSQTLIVGAVQQARVLRDILFQRSSAALQERHGGRPWMRRCSWPG